MAVLTRDQFLKPLDRPSEKVFLPEFGEDSYVVVRGMSARERNEFDVQFTGKRADMREVRERLLVATVCDDAGKLLFTREDVRALGEQSAHIVERIVNAAQRVCGMADNDVEKLAKN